ncbi:molybdopterin-dependent oxidoreductase [Variovorax sp. J22R133]|uniref:xanthine dehydrogenase family protein molybdopterin-binding subunit n=1 Tax=Variovorax brevis TaxID=3053503 RepID=UPI0025753844|nr:molybdopterin cofactor-binding domain-containing protein [Variovorax sp. J22R133]MDM0113862.1 molybdopterin-dependent oxidoreductase [Variovorax sp. J22R133]
MKQSADVTRRGLLKLGGATGISVWLAPLFSPAYAALFEDKLLTPIAWNGVDGSVKFRIDGTAKVAGEKIFACDIRSRDLPHWPQKQSHALLLRAAFADRIFTGVDLAALGEDLKPDRLVTAEDLARDRVAFPAFYGEDMLLPTGKTPAYLGHAVALLIYHDFARFRYAKERLRGLKDVVRGGNVTGPLERAPYAGFRYVRVSGDTPGSEDKFSPLKDTVLFPASFNKTKPVWPDAVMGGKLNETGMAHAKAIADEIGKGGDDLLVLDREYFSQSIDTAALEPDNANGWYDAGNQTLHMVVPTQGPIEVMESMTEMLSKCNFTVKKLFLHPCYTVGYGSKDHYNFPYYGAMAAFYAGGVPVRLANDRFEQFQTSIKRHSIRMKYRIAVDRKSGMIKAMTGDFVLDGGGRVNFTPSVTLVSATSAQTIYYLPKSDFAAVSIASRAVDCGSARGYGALQAMGATEMLIDEVAEKLGLDPVEFRLKNVIKSGMKNSQGAVPGGAIRADEVMLKLQKHPTWTGRAKKKTEYEAKNPGKRYGVGFGCTQKDYGTGAESNFVKLEVTPDGRILMWHSGAEMGTGMSTSQAVMVKHWLGRPADVIETSVTQWSELPMVTSGDPYMSPQSHQDKAISDPRWTPNYCSPSSASNSAFYFSHGSYETARVLFEHGLWPAAVAIWSAGIGGGQAAPFVVRRDAARWNNGKLTCVGMEPLTLARLGAKAHEMGLVTGVVGHVFNRWQWAEADFEVDGENQRRPMDGLAVRYGDKAPEAKRKNGATAGGYQFITRKKVNYPPIQRNNAGVTYYAAIATLAEVAIDTGTGKVELLSHDSVLECGNQIVPQLVSGQIQGGVAMGIGHALHEYMPLYEDGPGNGTWNFNRYTLPRASDVAVWKQTGEVLPALSDTDPPKGMGEVVMISIVPAIVNAVAHAIGHRFTELPVTAEKIRGVLK